MNTPVEALSPLRPTSQTPARAEERPTASPERARAEKARGAQAKAEGLGQHLDVTA
jgi:hypothetical protein